MTILVATETVLLVLLALLVVGLLRSHAEILRRLGPPDEDGGSRGAAVGDLPVVRRDGPEPAPDIAGATLDGVAVQIGMRAGGEPTLLAFLSSGCDTCRGFWQSLGERGATVVPGGGRVVAVTKDRSHESPARLRELAPPDLPLVMSSAAWEDYAVPTTPYFVYVDGLTGEIHGEGAASGWAQVTSLLRDALDDVATATAAQSAPAPRAGSRRERITRADRELAESGIGPGHPSLYPGGGPNGR